MGPVKKSARTLFDDFRYELGELGLAESLDFCREYGPDPGDSDAMPARRIVEDASMTVDRLTARLASRGRHWMRPNAAYVPWTTREHERR